MADPSADRMNGDRQRQARPRNLLVVARSFLGIATIIAASLGGIASGLLPEFSSAPLAFMSSRWSHVFHLPVGYIGAVLYGALFVLSGFAIQRGGWVMAIAQTLAMVTALIAIHFTIVQHFFTGGLCGWCGIVHGLAVGGATLLLLASLNAHSRVGNRAPTPETIFAALGIVATLALVQSLQPDKALAVTVQLDPDKIRPQLTSVGQGHAHLISLYGGRFTINPEHYPVIGSIGAENFIVVVMDYLSDDCRATHRQLVELQRCYGNQLAIVELPGTTTPESAHVHRSMLELRAASKHAFVALSELICGTEHVGELSHARIAQEIQKRVPASSLRAAQERDGRMIEQRLAIAREVQEAASNNSEIPKLPHVIVRSQVVAGMITLEEYAQIFERNLHLPMPALSTKDAIALKPPTIEIEAPEIDLGHVSPGMEIPISISFSNGGQSPLEVTWVRFGQDCKIVEVPKNPIHGGQSADIQVMVSVPRGRQGPFERTFTIYSNASPSGNKVSVSGSI